MTFSFVLIYNLKILCKMRPFYWYYWTCMRVGQLRIFYSDGRIIKVEGIICTLFLCL